jgi:seryl-tRNA synthetase
MPAKTPARKPSGRKVAARKSTPAHKNGVKHKNGVSKNGAAKTAELIAAQEALQAEHQKVQNDLAAARYQIGNLEKLLEEARSSGAKTADLEQQLKEMQARLTTHKAELEATRAESDNLREAVARASVPPPVKLGCPRCGKPMADYQHDTVRAKRCEGCHGVFFDNGELDTMMKHHDSQVLAGKKGWLSSFFGRK